MKAKIRISWALWAAGCSGAPGQGAGTGADSGISPFATGGETSSPPLGTTTSVSPGDDSVSPGSTGSDSSEGSTPPKFDFGPTNDSFCATHNAGLHCDGATAVECGPNGDMVDQTLCTPGFCLPGDGCVACLAGQYSCLGDRVRQCDDAADPPAWQDIATCITGANQVCDVATGSCVTAAPIGFPCTTDSECAAGQQCAPGPTGPGQCITGRYYKFASFTTANGLVRAGYDVDCWENRIYIAINLNEVEVYDLTLLDSDGDNMLEPNQHPDNPDNPGPVEERMLTYVDTCSPTSPTCTLPMANFSPSSAELYVDADHIFVGGQQITSHSLSTGLTTISAGAPVFRLSQIGYDDVSEIWYASNEGNRRVYQYNATTTSWGIAFDYPPLAGSHMDGLEVVTQPGTNIAYVYVSDMTSDYIGQYHVDPEQGWVQDNLFAYDDDEIVVVEGMGFGALNHFWATGDGSLYEIGGGDITMFVEPPPPPE